MQEVWLPIQGYEGIYEVSNLGRVKRVKHFVFHKNNTKHLLPEKMLKPTKRNYNTYYSVGLWMNNIDKRFTVHRLMAIHFIPNPENKPHINHIDGNKDNNSLSNLEWVTRSENLKHAMSLGVMRNQFKAGYESKLCKLTPDDVRGIKKMRKEGKTLREIGCVYGISGRHVSGIARGETHSTTE